MYEGSTVFEEERMTEKNQLKKQMKTRHITMLALGGAIGAGLFKGSGEAIQLAGPAVVYFLRADLICRHDRPGSVGFI